MTKRKPKPLAERVEMGARTRRDFRVELTREDILDLLAAKGVEVADPDRFSVFTQVPTGGDYSGCQLDLPEEAPIVVTWIEETEA